MKDFAVINVSESFKSKNEEVVHDNGIFHISICKEGTFLIKGQQHSGLAKSKVMLLTCII